MQRRTFLVQTSGLMISIAIGPSAVRAAASSNDRLGMSTVTFRNRFKQTKPASVTRLDHELTLLEVPRYYKERFAVRHLEFWSNHFESLEPSYLEELRSRIAASGAQLLNVQVDADYNLASTNEDERQRSLKTAREWIDAAASLRSRAVRVNPGRSGGSVEKSIASMQEVNRYCRSKGLPLLIENHFGLEMDPDIHLRIREAAGPDNVYTLPDFGNYPTASMWESLKKILPFAYMVSAKTVRFNDSVEHLSYDFDRCVRMAEQAGFKGIYSVEQWSREELSVDAEKIADWMLKHVRSNI
jgi:sugar phosphate isomerase/epimerase